MNAPEPPPPSPDEPNQKDDETVLGPQEVVEPYNNVWVGLIGGLVPLGVGVGAIMVFADGAVVFFWIFVLVLISPLVSRALKYKKLSIGLLLSLGVFFILVVGGCMLDFIINAKQYMH